MQRMKLDSQSPAVKKFVRSLPLRTEGIELELEGEVVCKVIPGPGLSDIEREALLDAVKESLQRSRRRNRGVSSATIAGEVDRAVESVRRQEARK